MIGLDALGAAANFNDDAEVVSRVQAAIAALAKTRSNVELQITDANGVYGLSTMRAVGYVNAVSHPEDGYDITENTLNALRIALSSPAAAPMKTVVKKKKSEAPWANVPAAAPSTSTALVSRGGAEIVPAPEKKKGTASPWVAALAGLFLVGAGLGVYHLAHRKGLV